MSLTDWSALSGSSSMGASSDQADAGTFSFQFDGSNGVKRVLQNDESATIAPKEGKVETRLYPTDADGSCALALFRIQDANNFIYVGTERRDNTSFARALFLGEVVGGTVDNKVKVTATDWTIDTWQDVTFLLWENPEDTINARMTDVNGQVAGQDVAYSGVDPALTGGAIGIGTVNVAVGTMAPVYWDETEVFQA